MNRRWLDTAIGVLALGAIAALSANATPHVAIRLRTLIRRLRFRGW